jgi:hypothetical protein
MPFNDSNKWKEGFAENAMSGLGGRAHRLFADP